MNKLVKYIQILGIVQLLGLNLGGIFWLYWADGLEERKASSRKWIMLVHSLYILLASVALTMWLLGTGNSNNISIYYQSYNIGKWYSLLFILFLYIIYGLPLVFLMNRKVKQEFK